MIAFRHKGFWQCMDTLRDKKILKKKLNKKILNKKKNFNFRRNWLYRIPFSKKMLKTKLVGY